MVTARDRSRPAATKDRVRLVYRSEVDPEAGDIELPFRILVLADLGGDREQAGDLVDRRPIHLNRENYDRVLAAAAVRLRLSVADHVRGLPDDPMDLSLQFNRLEDFGPDAIAENVPDLKLLTDLHEVLEAVRDGRGDLEPLSDAQHALAARMGFDDLGSLQGAFVNLVIAEIVERLSRQMDAILQHPDLQRLESAWRSLRILVEEPVDNASVHVVDVTKAELMEDFADSPETSASYLFQITYSDEYGQYGGHPYAVIIGDYRFSGKEVDLQLLRDISAIASMAHAPFLAAVSPVMFGLSDVSSLPGFPGLADYLDQGVQHSRWRSFRSRADARYVALLLPGFRLRAPWHYATHGIRGFAYRERVGTDIKRILWGNPAFAMATCLLRSFERSGWSLDMIGSEAGRVDVRGVDDDSLPTEIILSERREAELAESGFIPLTVHSGDNRAAFYSANSVYQPIAENGKPLDGVDVRIGAQLPYLFVMSRLAHYIKVIQRDNIGVSKTRAELESELNRWLIQYVSDMDNPAPGIRARRPLRRASIRIETSDREAGWYRMNLDVTPHFRYLGAAFQLNLESRLDPPLAAAKAAGMAELDAGVAS